MNQPANVITLSSIRKVFQTDEVETHARRAGIARHHPPALVGGARPAQAPSSPISR